MSVHEASQPVLERLRQSPLPVHVAIIMDGNGRWAAERGLPRWEGHRAGMKAVREVIEGSIEAGIRHLTLYAFSQENWDRPADEVSALMALLEEYVASEKDELVAEGVRVGVFGEHERLSDGALAAIREIEAATADGEALDLHLAISYGSRAEITRACRRLAEEVVGGARRVEEIDEASISAALFTAAWPDPDLLIRTSGELRVSNFLLWQVAYSELWVTPTLWPDFDRSRLFEAILDFQRRDRRFGRVEA